MQRKGFTLIELLVVITVISILAAILFPVFQAAKEKAKDASCLSNMKYVNLGLMMYAVDWNDTFPNTTTTRNPTVSDPNIRYCDWSQQLIIYTGGSEEILRCPSLNGSDRVSVPTDYVLNGYCTHAFPISQIAIPGDQISIAERQSGYNDCDYHPCYLGGNEYADLPPWNLSTDQLLASHMHESGAHGTNAIASERHNGGANYGFCDGHVRWMRWVETYCPSMGINLHNTTHWTMNP